MRRAMRERLKDLTAEQAADAGIAVQSRLASVAILYQRGAMGFLGHGGEVDLWNMLEDLMELHQGIILPLVGPDGTSLEIRWVASMDDVAPGYRGIMEPVRGRCAPAELDEVEAVLVPGLAFDRHGARLGRGGGHFDRLLAQIPDHATRIGVCHDWQLIDGSLPTEPHDQKVDMVCTPSQFLRTGARR